MEWTGQSSRMAELWRRLRMPALTLWLGLALAGCGHRTSQDMLAPVALDAAPSRTVSLLVATPRGLDRSGPTFTNERAKVLSYNRLKVAIPAKHRSGQIEWPIVAGDTSGNTFTTVENELLTAEQFSADVNRMIPPSGEVQLFVHGFNTAYEEGVYRLAQMEADFNLGHLPILFSWPSRGDLIDYLTDRESALSARPHLRRLLEALARHPKVRRINLLAHSMGTMLTMETLVHMKLAGTMELNGKLNVLALASPDIDVDVFQSQFGIVGRRGKPTVIMISRDDKALAVSRRLAGDVVRVGNASARSNETARFAEKMGLTVIDLSDVQTSDATNHTKFAAAPELIKKMAGELQNNHAQHGAAAGTFFVDKAGDVLDAPGRLLRKVTGH